MPPKDNPLDDASTAQDITIDASDAADEWAINTINGNAAHQWHGFSCNTCLGRYVVLTTAFDAGYQHGIDETMRKMSVGGGFPGGVPIIGRSKAGDPD
jgi:hypothetical protein